MKNIRKPGEGGRDQGDHHHMDQRGFIGFPFRKQIVRQQLPKKQQPVPDTALHESPDHIGETDVRFLIHLLQKSIDLPKIQLFQKGVRVVRRLLPPEVRNCSRCRERWCQWPLAGRCPGREHRKEK